MLPKRCSSCPVNPLHELIFDYLLSVAWRRKRAAALYSRIFSIKWKGILQSIKGTNADITVNKQLKRSLLILYNSLLFIALFSLIFLNDKCFIQHWNRSGEFWTKLRPIVSTFVLLTLRRENNWKKAMLFYIYIHVYIKFVTKSKCMTLNTSSSS